MAAWDMQPESDEDTLAGSDADSQQSIVCSTGVEDKLLRFSGVSGNGAGVSLDLFDPLDPRSWSRIVTSVPLPSPSPDPCPFTVQAPSPIKLDLMD